MSALLVRRYTRWQEDQLFVEMHSMPTATVSEALTSAGAGMPGRAVEALGKRAKTDSVARAELARVARSSENLPLRVAAASWLGECGETAGPHAHAMAEVALAAHRAGLRNTAIGALGGVGPDGVEALLAILPLLTGADRARAESTLHVLLVGERKWSDGARAREALRTASKSSNESTRTLAESWLARIKR